MPNPNELSRGQFLEITQNACLAVLFKFVVSADFGADNTPSFGQFRVGQVDIGLFQKIQPPPTRISEEFDEIIKSSSMFGQTKNMETLYLEVVGDKAIKTIPLVWKNNPDSEILSAWKISHQKIYPFDPKINARDFSEIAIIPLSRFYNSSEKIVIIGPNINSNTIDPFLVRAPFGVWFIKIPFLIKQKPVSIAHEGIEKALNRFV